MREWLLRAPWWARALVYGGYFWVVEIVVGLIEGHGLVATLLGSVVGAVVFGVGMAFWAQRFSRRYLAARGDLSPAQRRELRGAVRRGPAPADPRVREAAVRVVDFRLSQYRRQKWWAPAFCVLILVMCVVLAAGGQPLFVFLAAFWTAILIWTVAARRRTEHRHQVMATWPAA